MRAAVIQEYHHCDFLLLHCVLMCECVSEWVGVTDEGGRARSVRIGTSGSSVQRWINTSSTISTGHATPYTAKATPATDCPRTRYAHKLHIEWVWMGLSRNYLHGLVLVRATRQPGVFRKEQQRLQPLNGASTKPFLRTYPSPSPPHKSTHTHTSASL